MKPKEKIGVEERVETNRSEYDRDREEKGL